ncbi:substrate-binding domain-containing protein [Jejubacter calystegiae]|uniref:Substrate-binding domain-containing protein n=1 Tax=Jejubacter calystegiae TaxID=2579935 RepID=A0A4P8YSU7_9ENTR|nr:substrate-binding domain-containing protein [Jejubacter calystegiae]
MTHIMQRIGALCAAAALFGFSTVAMAKPLTIGMSFQEMNNAYFVTMKEALDQAAGEINAQVITADARHDVSKQINDIEDMLQKKIDILLINPADSVGVESAVNEAKKAGVVVIAIDAQAQGPIDAFVGSKNYDAGFKSGEYLAKALGGKGKVAILDGIPVVPILERVKGFEAAMKKYPDIEIVTKQNGRQERDTAMTVTENMLQGNPDLAGLFSVNDVGALGALSAIQANGASIKLVSVDGHPEAIKEIMKPNSPFIATSAQYPRDMVRLGIGVALAKHWGSQVPKTVPLDVKLITKDNGKDFSW